MFIYLAGNLLPPQHTFLKEEEKTRWKGVIEAAGEAVPLPTEAVSAKIDWRESKID